MSSMCVFLIYILVLEKTNLPDLAMAFSSVIGILQAMMCSAIIVNYEDINR